MLTCGNGSFYPKKYFEVILENLLPFSLTRELHILVVIYMSYFQVLKIIIFLFLVLLYVVVDRASTIHLVNFITRHTMAKFLHCT